MGTGPPRGVEVTSDRGCSLQGRHHVISETPCVPCCEATAPLEAATSPLDQGKRRSSTFRGRLLRETRCHGDRIACWRQVWAGHTRPEHGSSPCPASPVTHILT